MDGTARTELQSLWSTSKNLLAFGPFVLYSNSVPEYYIQTSTPLWDVEDFRSAVPVKYTYKSTISVDRTASTEPQHLYSTDIFLLPLWAVQRL